MSIVLYIIRDKIYTFLLENEILKFENNFQIYDVTNR